MEKVDKYHLICRLPFFEWLDEETKKEFLVKSKVLQFKRLQNLTEEIKYGDDYLIIIEGAIKVVHATDSGMHSLMLVNEKVFYIKLTSLIINRFSSKNNQIIAEIIGKKNGHLLTISSELFHKVHSNNQRAFNFFKEKKFKLSHLTLEKDLVRSLVRPRDRVIGCLYLTSKYFSKDVADGKILAKWITMNDLADYACTTKRTVVNVYSDLQQQNLLETLDSGEKKLKMAFFEKYVVFS